MQTRRLGGISLLVGTLAFLSSGAGRANADLTLTSTASAQGFTLNTFADGFPTSHDIGPMGITFPSGGGVLVTDFSGNVRLFATDANGQHAANAPVIQNYGDRNAVGLAQVGGSIFMTQQANNSLVLLNPNGTFNQTVLSGVLSTATGILANPANGHLFVTSSHDAPGDFIYDVNPAARTATVFARADVDGMAITPDGKTLYAATENGVVGFDVASGTQVYQSGAIGGIPHGIALGMGNLAGNLFVNTHDGSLLEINLATQLGTLIATGGSRGDFVTAAPDGSLLLTQTDSIVRLTPPSGGSFVVPAGGGDPAIPEPSSLALLGLGLALLGWRRWQKYSG